MPSPAAVKEPSEGSVGVSESDQQCLSLLVNRLFICYFQRRECSDRIKYRSNSRETLRPV